MIKNASSPKGIFTISLHAYLHTTDTYDQKESASIAHQSNNHPSSHKKTEYPHRLQIQNTMSTFGTPSRDQVEAFETAHRSISYFYESVWYSKTQVAMRHTPTDKDEHQHPGLMNVYTHVSFMERALLPLVNYDRQEVREGFRMCVVATKWHAETGPNETYNGISAGQMRLKQEGKLREMRKHLDAAKWAIDG